MLAFKRRYWCGILVLLGLIGGGLSWHLTQPTADELFAQGVAALMRGDIFAGERIVQRLKGHSGATPYQQALNGGLLLHSGRYQEALIVLSPELATGKQREAVLVWAGECFVKQRDLARAEIMLRTAAQEFPENQQAARLLAVIYYDLGAMHPALQQLKKLQQFDAPDYRPYHMSGTIYLDFEQFDNAIIDLRAALDREPPPLVRDAIALDLAVGLRRLLRFDEALSIANSVRPTARSHAEIALCQLGTGHLPEAIRSVQDGQRLAADDPQLCRAEAQVLIEQKLFEPALVTLRKLVKLEPHDFETQYKLASVLKELGRDQERIAALDRFNELVAMRTRLTELNDRANQRPYDADLRLELADLCRQLGRLDLEQDWRNAAAACRESALIRSLQPQSFQSP